MPTCLSPLHRDPSPWRVVLEKLGAACQPSLAANARTSAAAILDIGGTGRAMSLGCKTHEWLAGQGRANCKESRICSDGSDDFGTARLFRALLVESVAPPAVALYEAQVDGGFSSPGPRGVSLDPDSPVHAKEAEKESK